MLLVSPKPPVEPLGDVPEGDPLGEGIRLGFLRYGTAPWCSFLRWCRSDRRLEVGRLGLGAAGEWLAAMGDLSMPLARAALEAVGRWRVEEPSEEGGREGGSCLNSLSTEAVRDGGREGRPRPMGIVTFAKELSPTADEMLVSPLLGLMRSLSFSFSFLPKASRFAFHAGISEAEVELDAKGDDVDAAKGGGFERGTPLGDPFDVAVEARSDIFRRC
jgi:hypothetical protein